MSKYESFASSVSEAMDCGCTPIVTPNGNLPKLIKSYGDILNNFDVDDLINLINEVQMMKYINYNAGNYIRSTFNNNQR